jgi:hypothetical protein
LALQAKANGFDIKAGIARGLVLGQGGPDPMDNFKQFQLLWRYVDVLREYAPTGRYELSVAEGRFKYLYIRPQGALERWSASRLMLSIDGASVDAVCGGTLLTATNLSANNHLQLLAFEYCSLENGPNCTQFIQAVAVRFLFLQSLLLC